MDPKEVCLKNKKFAAIVLAGGRGTRMKSDVPKQYLEIKGKPVLYYALKAFQDSAVDTIVLVTGKEEISYCKEHIVEKYGLSKVRAVVEGGSERYYSVFNGLKQILEYDYVLIHDGARPFVTQNIIYENMRQVVSKKACVTGVPSKDTVKLVDEQNIVASTPDRSRVWIIQTPQTFETDLVYKAYETVLSGEHSGITDDAMVVEAAANRPVHMVMGDYRNIKITTPEDLAVAQVLVSA